MSRQVFEALEKSIGYGFLADFAAARKIAEVVWTLYYKERDAGNFKIRILFFTKDVSGFVAELLTKWFGSDPLAAK